MFVILNDKTICLTRGDVANINVSANMQDGEPFIFAAGDVLRFTVFAKKDCNNVVISKDAIADTDTATVFIKLTSEETKIGDIINKPVDYWYEVVLNPDTEPQTIIGYDENGEKIFRLYPEGGKM